jgi:flagellar biosynthesis protein FliR
MSQWWSWTLTIIGVSGLYLVGKRSLWGWIIGIFAQLLWLVYAIVTEQWGFIASALAYGSINLINFNRWRSEKKELANGRFLSTASK